MATPQERIRHLWSRLGSRSVGRMLFSRLLGRLIPYTGSIRPMVRELGPGLAVVAMRDRRGVRNHLGSIHAVALANLAEVASGLALNYALPDGSRSILVRLEIEYLKKARGTLLARGESEVPTGQDAIEEREIVVPVAVKDEADDLVVRGHAHWRIGSTKQAAPR